MRTSKIATIAAVFFLNTCFASAGVLLQGFYWDASTPNGSSWWDYLSEKSADISLAGYSAIWLPPVFKGASGGYSNGYDMFDDYDLGSKFQRGTFATKWGTRDQLQNAVAKLRAQGLDVYLDMNLNHRMGDDGDKVYSYTASQVAGRFGKSHWDFEWNDTMFGRHLRQSNSRTAQELIHAGDWVSKALGIQGMRFDFAKADTPEFLRSYLNQGAIIDSSPWLNIGLHSSR